MALLHYENLDVPRPDMFMRMSVSGFKIFYDFLTRTRRHMEREDAAKRLAWSLGRSPDSSHDNDAATPWVQLAEPEATFRAFLNENVEEVHEWKTDEQDRSPRRRQCRFQIHGPAWSANRVLSGVW